MPVSLRNVSGRLNVAAHDIRLIDLLPDVLDVDQGRDGADLGVLRAL